MYNVYVQDKLEQLKEKEKIEIEKREKAERSYKSK